MCKPVVKLLCCVYQNEVMPFYEKIYRFPRLFIYCVSFGAFGVVNGKGSQYSTSEAV